MTDFNRELAIALLNSSVEYPVDFDEAWQWLGYSTKQKAFKTLNNNFEDGIDFLAKGLKTSTGGRPSDLIVLTIDCFKSMGMIAGTDKGKVSSSELAIVKEENSLKEYLKEALMSVEYIYLSGK